MKNIFYKKALSQTSESLTERDVGIRRQIAPFMREKIIKPFNKKKIIVESYPELKDGQQYIFAAGHSFPDEIAANISIIDRHVYTLIGTIDQVINNPKMAILWLYGMLIVLKDVPESRRDSFLQMGKVLDYGSSVHLFPGGVLNNSENALAEEPYPGFYHLGDEKGKLVVPIVSNTYNDSKIIKVRASEPVDVSKMFKFQALTWWKEEIARLRYEMMEEEPTLERNSLAYDVHKQWMESRRDTYRETNWHEDVWDIELMTRKVKAYLAPSLDYGEPIPENIFDWDKETIEKHMKEYISFIEATEYLETMKVTPELASMVAPTLVRRREINDRYNFKQYMHNNWDK